MCYNQGPLDKALRVSVGIALIVYGVIADNTLYSIVGIVPLLTGFVGFCPAYFPFKLNSGCTKD